MVIYSELIINILFVIYAIILLVLLFNYSRLFPVLIIAFYISNLVFVLGDYIIASQIPFLNQVDLKGDDYKEILKSKNYRTYNFPAESEKFMYKFKT